VGGEQARLLRGGRRRGVLVFYLGGVGLTDGDGDCDGGGDGWCFRLNRAGGAARAGVAVVDCRAVVQQQPPDATHQRPQFHMPPPTTTTKH